MRVVREIQHPHCKITVYFWNNRYLVKLEEGMLEQTFKIDQWDIVNDEEILQIVDDKFIEQALNRFREMSQSMHDALLRGAQ